MQIHQLSLFLENKPGQLLDACKLLAGAGVSVQTLTLADTQDFGILRLIVREWQRAREMLEAAGFVVAVTDVLALEVADRPGGSAKQNGSPSPNQVSCTARSPKVAWGWCFTPARWRSSGWWP